MNDDQLTAYHADQRAKGAAAVAHTQGLGFPASQGCVTISSNAGHRRNRTKMPPPPPFACLPRSWQRAFPCWMHAAVAQHLATRDERSHAAFGRAG